MSWTEARKSHAVAVSTLCSKSLARRRECSPIVLPYRVSRNNGCGDLYLALIERKPRSLDQAAPLDGWVWSEDMLRLRRLIEACGGPKSSREGKRKFIAMLRLYEAHRQCAWDE